MDKGDVVNTRLFHQRAINYENCNNELLEEVARSQKQDMSACSMQTR